MLSLIGRAATRRLISAPAPTSSYRIVVSRLAAVTLGPNRDFVRSLTQGTKKSSTATTTKSATKPTATKGRTKTSTKATASKPKSKAKAKAKSKSKTKSAKSKPALRKKKVLTPEQKAALERKILRETALFTEPKPLPDNAWRVFVAEQTTNKPNNPLELGTRMSQLSQQMKGLPASEQQRLATTAQQNRLSNAAAYKAWVESHTPVQINSAIKARQLLKRKYGIPKSSLKTIRDERLPKKPTSAYSLFTKARWASGELAGLKVTEAAKEIGRQWKALPETERHAYEDLSKSNSEHYDKEVQSVLHREVRRRPSRVPDSP
ncbi:hypothetical protein F5Y06DRAFT_258931 [Hypoxylon sp. FL0890]|nr:hypothetical protein F5Y06DRAFT_258931 [Hypoxylon sp. FL0890]